jgi:hypothetical protein
MRSPRSRRPNRIERGSANSAYARRAHNPAYAELCISGDASLLLVGLAALVGMFSTQAAQKLKDIAEGIFSKAVQGANHVEAASPASAQTALASTANPAVPVADPKAAGAGAPATAGATPAFGAAAASIVNVG